MTGREITKRQFLRLAAVAAGGTGLACLTSRVSGWIPEGTEPERHTDTPLPSSSNQTAKPELLNTAPPEYTQKLIFIHHSTGEAWLADNHGGLGLALRDNNYFVSDTNYGWGPAYPGGGTIGDNTDIGHWYDWFLGPNSDTYLAALFGESDQHCNYSRLSSDPGGENSIVMFKSCFPNSAIEGQPNDEPTIGINPLYSQGAGSGAMTVGNIKGLYRDLLTYFSIRQDKLFVVITAPPLVKKATNVTQAGNARAVNTWLTKNWLAGYPHKNVTVFDFYNVLTSNGGSATKNDKDFATGNHHRITNGIMQYITNEGTDFCMYGSSSEDSHPTAAGDLKATAESLPLLNAKLQDWIR